MRSPQYDPDRHERSRIREEAIDWMLRLSEEGADDAVRAEGQAWRSADPRHDEAFVLAERTWQAVPKTEAARARTSAAAPRPGVDERKERGRWRRWFKPPLAVAGPVGFAAAAAVMLVVFVRPPAPEAITSPVGEVRQIALEDGSTVDLGAASRMHVAMSGQERRVTLEDGQAFFAVAHDPARPFIVTAGDAEIRVTGTKFDVWTLGDHVRVSVAEGSVEVRRPANERSSERKQVATLAAGDRVAVEDGRVVQSGPVPGEAEPGEWRSGRLYYADAPLSVVVADANRYMREPIVIRDDQLKATRVTVSFRTDEVDQLFGALKASLPVRIDRQDGRVTIAPQ